MCACVLAPVHMWKSSRSRACAHVFMGRRRVRGSSDGGGHSYAVSVGQREGDAVRRLHTKQTAVTPPGPHTHTHAYTHRSQCMLGCPTTYMHTLINSTHTHTPLMPAQTLAALLGCRLPRQPLPTALCSPNQWQLRDEGRLACASVRSHMRQSVSVQMFAAISRLYLLYSL